jgi:hypothetical protein
MFELLTHSRFSDVPVRTMLDKITFNKSCFTRHQELFTGTFFNTWRDLFHPETGKGLSAKSATATSVFELDMYVQLKSLQPLSLYDVFNRHRGVACAVDINTGLNINEFMLKPGGCFAFEISDHPSLFAKKLFQVQRLLFMRDLLSDPEAPEQAPPESVPFGLFLNGTKRLEDVRQAKENVRKNPERYKNVTIFDHVPLYLCHIPFKNVFLEMEKMPRRLENLEANWRRLTE